MKHNIKEIVKNHIAKFEYFTEGNLFYSVSFDNVKYTFPVNVTDTKDIGNSTILRNYKAITLMRYIRKAMEGDELRYEKLT